MAPSWVFAILIVLSAFLGTGHATSVSFCGDDQRSQCVDPQLCQSQSKVQFRRIQCPKNQICCRVEEINNLSTDELDEFA